MACTNLMTILQISDSGFPTGGFAHSLGLESALKHGIIRNKNDLWKFVLNTLENTGSFSLPFVREAHNACWDIEKLIGLDKECDACISNHVAKRASFRQGKSMLETTSKAFRVEQILLILKYLPHCHQPIIFGCVCGIMGVDLDSTLTTFVYSALRTVIASAVRLDKVGPIEAQVIQTDLQAHIPQIIERHRNQSVEEACMTFPVIDIVQNIHDTMFSKLFYS